ncbi:Uncharacterised protein [uncultured archaeon]|nr:Uncharacterised protein [uncultured archaeon]
MAMKMGDIRGMKEDALQKKLDELEMELVTGQGQGTKISSIKLSIARLKTHMAQAKKPVKEAPKHTGKHPVAEKAKVVGEKKSLNTGKKQ